MQAKTRERKAREGNGLRQRILDAARDLFVSKGYENVSMRKVAEKIEHSPTAIYLHFRDKAHLFECLAEGMYSRLTELTDGLRDAQRDPTEFLRRVLRAYVELGLAFPNEYRFAFLLSARRDMKAEEFFPRNSKALEAYDAFRSAVSVCVRTRRFRKVNVDAASQALWAVVHGVTTLLVQFPTFPWADRDALIDVTIDSMIRGLTR